MRRPAKPDAFIGKIVKIVPRTIDIGKLKRDA